MLLSLAKKPHHHPPPPPPSGAPIGEAVVACRLVGPWPVLTVTYGHVLANYHRGIVRKIMFNITTKKYSPITSNYIYLSTKIIMQFEFIPRFRLRLAKTSK